MSKRQSKTGVPHLVYQANTGFQYYLTFPKHFAANPNCLRKSGGRSATTKPWPAISLST